MVGITEWDLQQEQRQFLIDSQIFKPIAGVMAERFASSTDDEFGNEKKPIDAPVELKVQLPLQP